MKGYVWTYIMGPDMGGLTVMSVLLFNVQKWGTYGDKNIVACSGTHQPPVVHTDHPRQD